MSALPVTWLTPNDYLDIERAAEFKSEYFDGQMFAMAGGTHAHAVIIGRLQGELYARLEGTPCLPSPTELRVQTRIDGLYTYPDLVIVCGEPVYADGYRDMLLNPSVLIEVLSDSTEAKDRGLKFREYRRISSLREYVLCSQQEPRIEVFRRAAEDRWELFTFEGAGAVARLESAGCDLPLDRIYRKPLPVSA